MTVVVDVLKACNDGTIPETDIVESWIALTVNSAGGPIDAEVSVRIVDADESRALNLEYRGKDKPTNVLSFPAGRIEGLPDDVPVQLGDIVVCASIVSEEAGEQGKPVADHWAHMLVHGTLHLMGYDHETDAEATDMEALEKRILMTSGLTDPYRA